MLRYVKSPKDFFTGVVLLGIVAVYVAGLFDLRIGSISRPGPGYFPLMLTIMLFIFGVAILVGGFRTKGEPVGAVPWRALILITFAVIFFGATVKGLGFIPSLTLTVVITCLASEKWTWLSALTTAAILVVFSWFVFIWGLGLPVPLCGYWIRSFGLSIGISAEALSRCY